MKTLAILFSVGIMTFHGLVLAADDFQLPAPDLTHAKATPFWVTQYKVVEAKTKDVGVPLLDVNGKALTKPIDPMDWCMGAIEGTFKIDQDGLVKVFNFVSSMGSPQVDCLSLLDAKKVAISDKARADMPAIERSRFYPAKGPVGDGVHGYILVRYRTIAVDPKVIPYGSVVYIPKARGNTLRMPDGSMEYHDGFFLAADKGGLVTGNHFDVFCGLRTDNCMPSIIQSNKHKTLDAYVITDPEAKRVLEALHKPKP